MLQRLSALIHATLPDLYAPQASLADGPYTRFSTPEGTWLVILSAVWKAQQRPYLCHVSFHPRKSAPAHVQSLQFLCNAYPAHMQMTRRRQGDVGLTAAWSLDATDDKTSFSYTVDADRQVFRLNFPALEKGLRLDIACTDATPYSVLGPLGLARFLPLPSKWHVFSTRSTAHITLSESGGAVILETKGLAHQEKNFGRSFPTMWLWGQAFHPKGSLVFAGGRVAPGISSFLCGMRSPEGRRWNFGPVSSVQVLDRGPGIALQHDRNRGSVSLTLTDWIRGRRLRIRGETDPSSFVDLPAPMPEGHRADYCQESMQCIYEIQLEERQWKDFWPRFVTVEGPFAMEDGAPLEFGGAWMGGSS